MACLFLLDKGYSSFFAFSIGVFNNVWTTWHRRLGHLNNASLISLFQRGCLENSTNANVISTFAKSKCESCCLSKSHVLPFPIHYSRATAPFDVIHSDVWGIAPHLSRLGYRYYVTFIDDHCRYTWIYFLKFKFEVFPIFQQFYNMVSTQFQKQIKILRLDSGGEYMSSEFSSFLSDKGIIHQKSCPHTPQQNRIAERKNRHILETIHALLVESLVPPQFWCEAAHTAIHIINRLPTSVLHKISPYECLFRHSPSYSHLRVFGCLYFVHLPSIERNKLSPQAVRCMFLGYSDDHKGFLCYDPKDRRLRTSRNVVFLEHIPFYSLRSDIHPVQVSFLPQFQASHPATPSHPPPPITQVYVHHPKPAPPNAHVPYQLLFPAPSSGNDPPAPPPL